MPEPPSTKQRLLVSEKSRLSRALLSLSGRRGGESCAWSWMLGGRRRRRRGERPQTQSPAASVLELGVGFAALLLTSPCCSPALPTRGMGLPLSPPACSAQPIRCAHILGLLLPGGSSKPGLPQQLSPVCHSLTPHSSVLPSTVQGHGALRMQPMAPMGTQGWAASPGSPACTAHPPPHTAPQCPHTAAIPAPRRTVIDAPCRPAPSTTPPLSNC